MRELKFRAWDGKKLEYDVMPSSENSIIKLDQFEWYEKEVDIVEEYTGLKDLYGREIYEGDIVRYESDYVADVYFIEPVSFGKIYARYDDDIYMAWMTTWVDDGEDHSSLYEIADVCRVVGNIHENPELLEVKNE